MNNKFIRGAVGFAAVSAITLSGGMAFAKDAISIAVPSFLTGGAAFGGVVFAISGGLGFDTGFLAAFFCADFRSDL